MDRRNFIKLTAVTGSAATLAACGNPEHELIRFVPDEDLTPGLAEIKNGVCPQCGAGCGTTIRVMQGDVDTVRDGQPGVVTMSLAKKLEGNPTHPVNQGALCPRGQAAIQIAYHPDRIKTPLKRRGARGSGDFEPITWDAAMSQLVEQLDAHPPVCLTRPMASARRDVLAMLAEHWETSLLTYELFNDDVLRRANAMSFGRAQLPTFDLAASRYAISFGADFLGTWNSPVAHTAAYGRMRQGRPGIRGSFVQVEPRMSLTGASADEWVAIRPGTEGVLALGLAHVIMRDKLRPVDAAGHAGTLIDGWSNGLAGYTPQAVEQKTSVKAARIERLAREMAEQRPAVAIIGGAPLAQTNGLFQALAVNALNALLGSVNAPGGVSFTPQVSTRFQPDTSGSLPGLLGKVLASPEPRVLVLDGVNPVYASPPGWRVRDTLLKFSFIVSFGSFIDDTSVLADLILPDHAFLESFTDARPESGAGVAVATVAGPAMKPLYQTRATPDVVLDVLKKLKRPASAQGVPWTSFDQLLQAQLGEEGWATATKQGWVELKANLQKAPTPQDLQAAGKTTKAPARDAVFDGDAAQYPFHFMPFASQAFLDGSVSHLPWLQEMPDPISTAMWSVWVEINPQTAGRLGIGDGDVVEIASAHGAVHAPALISPGIAPDVLAMPVGQGHETFTRYASGRGSNPVKVLGPSVEQETGALAWAATRVKITRVAEADGGLIRFGGALTEAEHTHR